MILCHLQANAKSETIIQQLVALALQEAGTRTEDSGLKVNIRGTRQDAGATISTPVTSATTPGAPSANVEKAELSTELPNNFQNVMAPFLLLQHQRHLELEENFVMSL